MTFSLVGSASVADTVTSNTTRTLTIPAGVQAGDTLILAAVVATGSPNVTPSASAGASLVFVTQATETGHALMTWRADNVSASAAGATITITTPAQKVAAVLVAIRGAATLAFDTGTVSQTLANSTIKQTTISPNAAGKTDILFEMAAQSVGVNTQSTNWTAPSGYTKVTQAFTGGAATQNSSLAIAYNPTLIGKGSDVGGDSYTNTPDTWTSTAPGLGSTIVLAVPLVIPPQTATMAGFAETEVVSPVQITTVKFPAPVSAGDSGVVGSMQVKGKLFVPLSGFDDSNTENVGTLVIGYRQSLGLTSVPEDTDPAVPAPKVHLSPQPFYVFKPPTLSYGPAEVKDRLWLYYRMDVGLTVLKHQDGSYENVQFVSQDQVAAAAEVYLGGHEYTIRQPEALALYNAGYGDNLSADPRDIDVIGPDPDPTPDPVVVDPMGFGQGGFGVGPFGA
jgi:hypothetical protein